MTQELKEEFERYSKELSAWTEELIFPEYLSGFQIVSCLQNNPRKKAFLLQNGDGQKILFKYARGEFRQMLQTEHEISGTKKFPFFPYVIDYRETEEESFLLREYIEGSTLCEVIEDKGPLPLTEALSLIRKICRCLAALHQMTPPLIYRDLKPANIILTENGDCYLVDTGTVRQYQENDSPDTLNTDTVCMGTAGFAAPEQFGARQTDSRTDIYGLGVLFYYLLTGEIKIREATLSELPEKVSALIQKCTDFNPDKRYQNIRQLEQALAKFTPDRKLLPLTLWAAAASVLSLVLFLLLRFPTPYADQKAVVFSNSLLEQAVRSELDKTNGETVRYKDLKQISVLRICGTTIYDDKNQHDSSSDPHRIDQNTVETGNIIDISLLSQMPNLHFLTLDYQQIHDISSLRGLPLVSVSLTGNPITDLSPLSECTTLSALDIANSNVFSLEPLANCTSLAKLNCSQTPVADLTPLSALPITELSIMDIPAKDFAVLEQLPVVQLNCRYFPQSEIVHFKKMQSLRYLNIMNGSFTSLESFSGIPALIDLNVFNGSLQSLKGIEGLSGLRSITLLNNPITDASALTTLPNLQYLNLGFTGIKDFSFLQEMPLLRNLDISKAQLPFVEKAVPEPWFNINLMN